MSSYDWLNDIPESLQSSDLVEVQFKNTRKGYYLNTERIDLYKGDTAPTRASSSTSTASPARVTSSAGRKPSAVKSRR